MSGKAALKAVRTALDSKDFELAAQKASELVQQEPQNYHAYVRHDMMMARVYTNCNCWLDMFFSASPMTN